MVTQEDTGKEIGEMLKEKRRELNLSLKEAENATSIRMGHLKAIEEGDMDQLISSVYAQGFIRQYATFLGFDENRTSTTLYAKTSSGRGIFNIVGWIDIEQSSNSHRFAWAGFTKMVTASARTEIAVPMDDAVFRLATYWLVTQN